MTTFSATVFQTVITTTIPGVSPGAYAPNPSPDPRLTVDATSALDPDGFAPETHIQVDNKSNFASATFDGVAEYKFGPNFDWFNQFHVVLRKIELGNVLTVQLVNMEVYSSFRTEPHDWDSFTINVNQGVDLIGEPGLPFTVPPQTGVLFQVEVDLNSPPIVDSTIDFVFDVYTTPVPISFQLVQLWNLPPEMPFAEGLEFLTDVLPHKFGTEQRIGLRKSPRQLFEWSHIMDDDEERAKLDNLLFEWQSRSFGVPIWHEMSFIATAATAGDTTINVGTTEFADYRLSVSQGNLVLIYQDQDTFDVLPLVSKTSTSLTFTSSLINSYGVGVQVMPLRVGNLEGVVDGGRFSHGANLLKVRFRVRDNDAQIGSTAAFGTFEGKVLLDDNNGVAVMMAETFDQSVFVLDNGTGRTFESTTWPHNKRGSHKTFLTAGRQALWETRQLLWALGGRQTSFFLPTFMNDLQVNQDLIIGQSTMRVKNVGYTLFVQGRQPRDVIRVAHNDGADPVVLRVLSSSIIDSTTEELVLDGTWPATQAVATIDRTSYVEKVRFNSDLFRFEHHVGDRVVKIKAPVAVVLD